MTEAGRSGQECRADDLDEIEAAQDVRRTARPTPRPAEAQALAAFRAAQFALAREPLRAERPVNARRAAQAALEEALLDLHGRVTDSKHSQILASTSESSRGVAADGKGQLVLRMVEHRVTARQAVARSGVHNECRRQATSRSS